MMHMYFSVTSSSPTSASSILRKELLRKTPKELVKECRTKGLPASGTKGDIVDRLIKYHNRTPQNTLPHRRTRSSTISGTLMNSKKLKKRTPPITSLSPTSVSISNKSLNKSNPRSNKNKLKSNPRYRSQSAFTFKKSKKHKIPFLKNSVSKNKTHYNILDWFNDKFTGIKYDKLKQVIVKHDIKYIELKQINDLTLQLLDFTDKIDRQYILNEIQIVGKNMKINSPTNKQKQYETEITRLRNQISREKQDYTDLKKRYDKLLKTNTRTSISNIKSKKIWKANKSKSQMVIKSDTKSKKKRKKNNMHMSKLELGPAKDLKRKASRRYDEGFGIQIKGLSALNVFIEQYEKKKESKEKNIDELGNSQSVSDTSVGINESNCNISQQEIVLSNINNDADISTDDDFDKAVIDDKVVEQHVD
eukprot:336328_1